MFDTLRQGFYWRFMANDVHQTVPDFRSCDKTRGTTNRPKNVMKLFPAKGPLECVEMDILGPFPQTHCGNQFVLFITDRYSKLNRAVPMGKKTAPYVAGAFMSLWVYPYGIPAFLLVENGPQCIAQFFAMMCNLLGISNLTTTTYHPETNGQAERYKCTLVIRLRHYVTEKQNDRDFHLDPLTYA